MRRFGVGGGGMGGGSGGPGGGEGMLRTFRRAVRAGVGGGAPQEPFSHSNVDANHTPKRAYKSNTTANTKSSSNISYSLPSSKTTSPFSTLNIPISPTSTGPTWNSCPSPPWSDELDQWECVDGTEYDRGNAVDGTEYDRGNGFSDDFVFGTVPSKDEVHDAVSALQRVLEPKEVGAMHGVSSAGSELDWIEPSMQLCNSRMLQPSRSDKVYDAFHLLQTEPSIQRMVISLSSDKAVWDAVLNNGLVQEIRESLAEVESIVHDSSDEDSDGSHAVTDILSWVFVNTKAKIQELVEKITKLVNELFEQPEDKKATGGGNADSFEEKLRTSFLLSVVVLLIVVVTRANRA